MNVKCLIIDDEPLAINVIKNHLEKIDDIEVINTFSNAIDGMNFLKKNAIDLIFLDIDMPLLDGISFIEILENKPLIIITTAHQEYAIKTYELDVLDYLVKPISFSRFLQATNRAFKAFKLKKNINLKINKRPYIFIKIDKKKSQKIYLDEITVVESLKDYLKINTTTNRYIIHQTLSSFTDQLPSDSFIRIHRSYTVSIDKVDAIEGNSVEIEGVRYVIGRTYIEKVKTKILLSSRK